MPLLGAYSAAIERLQLNRFHWQRLVAPLHPAEPEVMAVVVSVNTLLIGRGTSLEDELEYLPMGQSARTIVTGFLAHYHTRGMERGEGELT